MDIDIPNQEFLVVDALITDRDTVHTITVSLTSSSLTYTIPVKDAEVYIEDQAGKKFRFINPNFRGDYSFEGKIAQDTPVKLVVNWKEEMFESTWEEYQSSSQIVGMDVTSRKSKVLTYLEEFMEIDLIKFHISHVPVSGPYYGLWKIRGRYDKLTVVGEGSIQRESIRENYSNYFQAVTAPEGDVFRNDLFETMADAKFNDYNLTLRQYSIDRTSYTYWLGIQKLRETTGSLFDSPMSEVNGNISNLADPQEKVLGNFTLARYSEKSFHITQGIIPIQLPYD